MNTHNYDHNSKYYDAQDIQILIPVCPNHKRLVKYNPVKKTILPLLF